MCNHNLNISIESLISPPLFLKKKCKENPTQDDLNQNKDKSTVIDDHMNQGKALRSLSFRKLPSQGDPDGEEKENENRQIGVEARSKNFPLQIE
jgi:hypothetical protein